MSRWKVYILAVLLGMAVLFYLETQFQQLANDKVNARLQQWLDQNHGQFSSHSYQILRDRLHLKQLSFDWHHMNMTADHTSIQLGKVVNNEVQSIAFRDLKMALPDDQPAVFLESLSDILSGIHQLKIEKGDLYLATKTWLHDINLQLQTLATGEKRIEGSFSSGKGRVNFQLLWDQGHWSSLELHWKNTDLSHILQYFNWPQLFVGRSKGAVTWQQEKGFSTLEGSIEQDQGKIVVSGQETSGNWVFDVVAKQWNSQSISFYMPYFLGRAWHAGTVSGDAHVTWQGDHSSWVVESRHLLLEHVLLQGEKSQPWVFPSIRLQTIILSPKHFKVSQMWLAGSHLDIEPDVLGDNIDLLHGWKGEVKEIYVDQLQVLAHMSEGEVVIPTLSGKGSFQGGVLHFDVEHVANTERWRLKGQWSLQDLLMSLDINVKGANLARFRHFVSQFWLYDLEDTTELMGDVDLDMTLQASDQNVRFMGGVQVNQLHVSQFGHQWQATSLHMDVAQVGFGLEQQRINTIRVDDWNYQFALSPITEPTYTLAQKKIRQWQGWHIGSLDMYKGSISMARRDATWLNDVTAHLESVGRDDDMSFRLNGIMAQQSLQVSGTVSPFAKQPSFDLKLRLRDVLPFFLNEWFQFSGLPHLIQGRVSTFLHVYRDVLRQEYLGELDLYLNQPVFASGTFAHDPFIELTGFSLKEVIQRMSRQGKWHLNVPLQIPDEYMLGQDVIAQAILDAMKQEMVKVSMPKTDAVTILVEHALRLHEASKQDQLSLNERVRLKEVALLLVQNRDAVVILRPQLGNQVLNAQLKKQIAYTQARIERLLRYKNVAASQIFPVWPSAEHRQGDVGGIIVLVQRIGKK